MKNFFPPQNQSYTYLQTNRSDDLGSLWSSFNLDFQTNLGTMRLAQKLVTNTTSSDDADLGLPVAFEFFYNNWWAICGTRIFKNSTGELTSAFTENTAGFSVGYADSQFDVTNPAGTTFRYTWDGTGSDPLITALTFPIGASVWIANTNMATANEFPTSPATVTGSGANYFEITNASGTVESNKTLSSNGILAVFGGTLGTNFNFNSDLKLFDDQLWATTGDQLYSKSNNDASPSAQNSWELRDDLFSVTVDPSAPSILCYFEKTNRLYYKSSANEVSSIGTDYVVARSGDYYISLGTTIGYISSLVATSQYIWIGTNRKNTASSPSDSGLFGSVVQWDGFSAGTTNEYELNAAGVLAMTVYDDIPYVIDSEGRILKYTGTAFQEIARLPVNRILLKNATRNPTSSDSTSGRFVHFNGFTSTKNNTLQVLINNLNEDATDSTSENIQSGIWELDLTTNNFTHRYSATLKPRSSSTVTDFGQNRVVNVGAIKQNTLMSDSTDGRSTLVAGFTYYTDASSTKSGIFIDSPASPSTDNEGQKRGYFVTTFFNSQEIQDKWSRLWVTFRRFLNSTDKIVFKYRLNEEDPIVATITWTSTTTFTTTTNVSAYGPTATGFNGTTGGEVEVLQGTGSGSCTHISSIINNGGTYTVTLDNPVTGVTGTAKARFQKWIKMFPEINGQVLSYGQMPIGDSNTRIQIKGVLEFTGDDEFHKFVLTSNEDIKATL